MEELASCARLVVVVVEAEAEAFCELHKGKYTAFPYYVRLETSQKP